MSCQRSRGRTTRLGRAASAKIVLVATRRPRDAPSASPVFGFTSYFGEVSHLFDATATDLSRFAARGGRIIWLHGHDDPSVSPLENRRNVEAIIARMGQDQADRFLRYFEVPGLAHGGGRFAPQWESLAALDAWVEHGTPPDGAIVTDGTQTETRGRTRPLCRFPTWPKFTGTGDARLAASFTCVAE